MNIKTDHPAFTAVCHVKDAQAKLELAAAALMDRHWFQASRCLGAALRLLGEAASETLRAGMAEERRSGQKKALEQQITHES